MDELRKKVLDLNHKINVETDYNLGLRDFIEKDNAIKFKGNGNDIHNWIYDHVDEIINLSNDNPEIIGLLDYRILYIGAECNKYDTIGIEEEYAALERIIANEWTENNSIQRTILDRVKKPTVEEMVYKLEEFRPEIVIFSCHGNPQGIYLEDENGNSKMVPVIKLHNIFRPRRKYTECVILGSCSSFAIAESILPYTFHVVAHNEDVNIRTSKKFTTSFVKYLSGKLRNREIYRDAFRMSSEIVGLHDMEDTNCIKILTSDVIP